MKTLSLLILATLGFIITSCAGSGADIQNYQDPAFSSYLIKKMAVLPIRNTYLNIGEANNVNRYFMSQLSRKTTKYEILGPEDAINKLSEDTLVEKYYNYLVAYATSGIPNRETIKLIGKSLNVDAIVQGEIYNIIKKDGIYGVNKGETRLNVRYSIVSALDGKLLWESTVEAYETTATTLGDAPSIMNVVMNGMNQILEAIPIK